MSYNWFRNFNNYGTVTFTNINVPFLGASVTVTILKNGLPYDSKTVVLSEAITTIVFTNVPYGEYTYTISGASYIDVTGDFVLNALTLNKNFTMLKAGKIVGIINQTNGNPIEGALVQFRQDGVVIAQTFTDGAGGYSSGTLPWGIYLVTSTAIEHRSKIDEPINLNAVTVVYNETLHNLGTIYVYVGDSVSHEPLENVSVEIQDGHGVPITSKNTDENGRVFFRDYLYDIYKLVLTMALYDPINMDITLSKVAQNAIFAMEETV